SGRPQRVRGADLAEDLGLAPDPRVEPCRDPEEVPRSLVVAAAVEGALGFGFAPRLGGPLPQARAGDVKLGAVAGREAGGLTLFAGQVARELCRLVGIESHALADIERRTVVRDADERELSQPEPPRGVPPRLRGARARAPSARRALARAAPA